jgi:glycine dehydrogenase subunit 1
MNYIPNTSKDQKSMLKSIGKASIDDLFADVPKKIKLTEPIPLLPPLSEPELLKELASSSSSSSLSSSFLGGGSYNHFIPSVVKHIVSRSEFYTAYTPYQAEASQGVLQAIYEYQTDAANASMYDGATALTEAAFLACRATGRKEILVSPTVHPEYRKVLNTYAKGADLTVHEIPYAKDGVTIDDRRWTIDESACVILQQPNFFGCIEDVKGLAEKIHSKGALLIISADPISLGILKAPGDYGADIVVGEGQPLGNPQSFGGPGLGLFAVKKEFARQMPGRIVGQTTDAEGKRGFCLTLQTREQHIRRERATSNICSNEALAALAATVYLSVMGKTGLRKVAELCLQKANYLKKKIRDVPSCSLIFRDLPCFKEFVVKTEKPVGLDLGQFYRDLKGCRLVCVTELTTKEQMDKLAGELSSG